MKIARKVVTMLVALVLMCTLLTTAALASEDGYVWVSAEQSDGTAALIMTNTTVTDGVIRVTYDSSKLTYVSTEVAEEYVAMYAVNAQQSGTVLISWVAPEAYTLTEEAVCLIRVNFTGVGETGDFVLTGTANDAQGNPVDIGDAPDKTALKVAVAEAEALDESKYTEESFAKVETALADAREVLADGLATQEEVDAAEAALRDAIAALEERIVETVPPTTGATETTEETKEPGNSTTGDDSQVMLFAVIGLASAACVIIMLVQMKKKGGRG